MKQKRPLLSLSISLPLSIFISCADLGLSHSFNHRHQQQHLHQNMESLSFSASGSITKLSSFALLLVVLFFCSSFTSTGQCLQTCLLSVPCLQISCLGSVSLVFCFWVLVSYQRSVPFYRNLAVLTYNWLTGRETCDGIWNFLHFVHSFWREVKK